MNVLAVGLATIAAYLVAMVLWLRYDARLDKTDTHGVESSGGEGR